MISHYKLKSTIAKMINKLLLTCCALVFSAIHFDNAVIAHDGGKISSIFAVAFSTGTLGGHKFPQKKTGSYCDSFTPTSQQAPTVFATAKASEENCATVKADRDTKKSRSRVVIIGAGVGGLATAALIQSSCDVEVIVLEKNEKNFVGGRCGSFDVTIDGVGTFRHERGPSLLLLKNEYESLFDVCGTKKSTDGASTVAESYGLSMKQCVPAYQVVFDDGDTVNLGFPTTYRNSDMWQSSIDKLNSFENNGACKWAEYLDTCAAFLDCGLPNFIEEKLDLGSFRNFLWEALRDGLKRWPLQPHSSMLDSLFTSPKMCALASFQDLYVGLEPFENSGQIGGGVFRKTAPAVFGLLAALELHPNHEKAGVFAPIGGFRQVAESMQNLCIDSGVKFHYETAVTCVAKDGVHYVSKNNETASNSFLPADLIICNADLPFATETIAKPSTRKENEGIYYEERYDWNDDLDYSSGVIAFHWSVSRTCHSLNTHNVFLCAKNGDEAKRSWTILRDNTQHSMKPSDPFNFYVHRACKTDDSAAPPGCDSLMVLVPCPSLVRKGDLASLSREDALSGYSQQFNKEFVDLVRDAVLFRLAVLDGLEDLTSSILDEVVETPATYANYYNVGAGVPFALSHGLGQLSITRPGAELSDRDNLLFVGASSRPGNGVPLVLIGAKAVAKKAIEKLERMV